jgi:hypothetical protein
MSVMDFNGGCQRDFGKALVRARVEAVEVQWRRLRLSSRLIASALLSNDLLSNPRYATRRTL